MPGTVVAVSRSATHSMRKANHGAIRLLAGLGVAGDAHMGTTVQHRSRVARDPTQPNLRQVHLIPAEVHDALRARGFAVEPGQMGENITTRDVELFALPTGTKLRIGDTAVVEITGLRNPCTQLDGIQTGLMSAVLGRDDEEITSRAGVMGVVHTGGDVHPGDPIAVDLPPLPHEPLRRV